MLRVFAVLLAVFGVLGAVFALNMSITAPGTDIGNFPLIAERQNVLFVAAVLILAGTILFAADLVRGGASQTTVSSTRTWAPSREQWVAWAPSRVQRINWARRTVKGLAVLACASAGVHWQNEPLTFGPFWILILWQIRKSVTGENRSPIWTTGVVLGLALVSLVFVAVFLGENEPGFPIRQLSLS